MGYSASPSYASEVSAALVPKQAEIETSAAIGSVKDTENAYDYIQRYWHRSNPVSFL